MQSMEPNINHSTYTLTGRVKILRFGFNIGVLSILLSVMPLWAASAKSVYIPLGDANQIAEVDPDSLKVRRLLGPVNNPHGLAISPDGRFLYAGSILEQVSKDEKVMDRPKGVSEADHKSHHAPRTPSTPTAPKSFSFITRIDAESGEIQRRINVERFTHHVTITPDGSRVIGVQSGASRLVVIDSKTDRVLRYVPVGLTPNYALVTRDSARVFVSNAGSNSLTVLDGKSWRTVATIPVGEGPEHLAFSPDEQFLYVVNVGSGELSIVDTEKLTEVKRVFTGKDPHGIAFNDVSKTVIVSNRGSDSVSVFDAKGELLQEFPLAPQPYHVANGSDENQVWISSRKQGTIWVLSTEDFTVSRSLEIPGIGHQLVKAP